MADPGYTGPRYSHTRAARQCRSERESRDELRLLRVPIFQIAHETVGVGLRHVSSVRSVWGRVGWI